MIYEPAIKAAEPLREPLDGAGTGDGVDNRILTGILILLLAIGIGAWLSYNYWSPPILKLLNPELNEKQAKAVVPERTAEQQLLIDATQGDLAEIVVTGANAEAVNEALPFSDAPISLAKSFQLAATNAVNAQTAQTCLTQAVYYEAGFEPLAGKRAVAQVVLNRMRHPAFPSSVCGVVYQGHGARVCQFSFTCDGALFRKPQAAAWASSKQVAVSALAGYVEPKVGTSTHYHADYVSPYWAPKLSKIAKLGAHIFYSWPGAWGRRAAFTSRYSGSEYLPPLSRIRIAETTIEPEEAVPDFAATGLSVAPSVTDRHAKNDVGGRLDVSKGWTLKIPDPSETKGRFGKLTSNQTGPSEADEMPVEGAGQ